MGSVLIPSVFVPIDAGVPVVGYDGRVEDNALANVEFFVPTYMGDDANLAQMSEMPNLRVCQLLTAGYDHVRGHLPDGVVLCNAVGVHDASTAELAVGLILASLRGIDEAARAMSAARWEHATRPALADRHVVIVGAGGVGQALRRRLEPFEAKVTMVGRTRRPGVLSTAELMDVIRTADVVVLAVPLDSSTHRLVGSTFLAAMKDGALLVNVARGKVVDTDALVDELASGRIRAALDVTEPEPLPPDHPLWHQPGVLITPHGGGDTTAFPPRARRLIESQARAWFEGGQLAGVVEL